jgi:ABC-type transport system substrate-binding protein
LPQVKEACEAIQEQAEAAGLKITLQGAPLYDVHRAVMREHKYELAFFSWEHTSDTFDLGPLLDGRAAESGGTNFLGPLKDAELEPLLTEVRDHRDFRKVKQLTQLIHQQLYQKMPLIPLWQLDTHLAIHADLRTVPAPESLDPLRIFTHTEQWRLEK